MKKTYLFIIVLLLSIGLFAAVFVWYTLQKITVQVGSTNSEVIVKENDTKEPITDKPVLTIQKSDLTDSQQRMLSLTGFDGEEIVVTESTILCAETKIDPKRLAEILEGATPSISESLTLLSCLRE